MQPAINTSEIGYFPRRLDEGNCTSTAEITIVMIALCFRAFLAFPVSFIRFLLRLLFRALFFGVLRIIIHAKKSFRQCLDDVSCAPIVRYVMGERHVRSGETLTLIDSDDSAFDWQNSGALKLRSI